MSARKRSGTTIVLMVFATIFYLQFKRGDTAFEQTRAELTTAIVNMPEFQSDGALLTQMADYAHTVAFRKTREAGHSWREANLARQTYTEAFFRSLIEQAPDRGRQDLIKPLLELQASTRAAIGDRE